MSKSLLILGVGAGALGLLSELSVLGTRDFKVTLVDHDPHLPSNPALFQSSLEGKRRPESLEFRPRTWYDTEGIALLLGREVSQLDRKMQLVTLDGGEEITFEHLVVSPSLEFGPVHISSGASTAVVHLRGVSDFLRLRELVSTTRRAVVLGGGPLGVETSLTLARLGLSVELICEEDHLLFDYLDPIPAAFVKASLEQAKVAVHLGLPVDRIETESDVTPDKAPGPCERRFPEDGGPLRLLLRGTSRALYTEIVVMANPSSLDGNFTRMVEEAEPDREGIHAERSSLGHDAIYVLGQHGKRRNSPYLDEGARWEQGRALARLLCGKDLPSSVREHSWRISTKELQLAVFGETKISQSSHGELVELSNTVRGTYKALRIEDGRMVGAVLVGDDGAAGDLCSAQSMPHVPLNLQSLLFGNLALQATYLPLEASSVVCSCNHVTKGAIDAALADMASVGGTGELLDAVVKATRATTGCGSCVDVVGRLVERVYEVDAELKNILDVPVLHEVHQ